ncbi:hypothetical protein [Actinoplanes utahensis]|uniref:Uncharacterized protein n=1 Tax=Actinoplanes utahensis TaxID=1869 RepID=A0A0A6UHB9_ACTUT|nr:hypothetical protein [Actinoplanes utahensis]KHD74811.1 hypothetical protein MB27_26700 [Actinoplanes utahensis]GIF35219.1 hypothetical protein Aut01nite_82050 [Actinoplanes utahensis]
MAFGWRRKKDDDVNLGLGLAPDIGRSRDGRYPRTFPPKPGTVWFEVEGRCSDGSFSPDGRELAVASGGERVNGTPDVHLGVYSTEDGSLRYEYDLQAYHVSVVHSGDGVFVADWQHRGEMLEPGALVHYTASRRTVLTPEAGINPMVGTATGVAALTYEGDLLLGGIAGVDVAGRPGPVACLAADRESGRLAAGGDSLVLLDEQGRPLATAPVDRELHQVAFLDPDRLVSFDGEKVHLWRHRAGDLTAVAGVKALGGAQRLVALPRLGVVLGGSRHLSEITMARIDRDTVAPEPPPTGLTGGDLWHSADEELLAVPSRYNHFLPPAPEQVEIFRTAALF